MPDWQYLAPRPESLYRQLFIKGTKIRARDLYGLYMNEEEPMTVDEIAADWGLPVEAVQEAIAYCETDPPEIRQDWEAEEALEQAMGTKRPGADDLEARQLTVEELARLSRL
jgi:uncharacterized protein (DUF433 family)